MKVIPYGRQNITEEDINAVVDVLRSDFLTQGPKIAEFEKCFANYVNAKYAVAVSNATAGLHIANLALGVKEGDRVITSPITFAASANASRFCGAEVWFADIDPDTYLLDINSVKALIESKPKGFFTGIVPVDFAGLPINLEAFKQLADKHGLWIIEDAAHAPGAYFTDSKGKIDRCGNGVYSDCSVFSFHPVKHIACGEGGMVTTNNKELYERLKLYRSHGITKDAEIFQNPLETALGFFAGNNDGRRLNDAKQLTAVGSNDPMTGEAQNDGQSPNDAKQLTGEAQNDTRSANDAKQMTGEAQNDGRSPSDFPGWYYEMQTLGYNYRLTDMQAALGISQLAKNPQGLTRRNEIAQRYKDAFKNTQIKYQSLPDGTYNAHHLFVIEVEDRKGLYDYLREQNIFAQIHYIPLHTLPYYQKTGYGDSDLSNAENYYKHCISLPMYPSLTNEEQNFVINCINSFYDNK